MAGNVVPHEVLAEFCYDPTSCLVTPLGCGNINDTYLVRCADHSFVLQKINSDVFSDPLRVIVNFDKISSHLSQKKEGVPQQLQVASPVHTLGNKLYFRDKKGFFWRGQTYLPHKSYQVLVNLVQARQVGRTLANFHRSVGDLDMRGFLDPLPGFHDLARYLKNYDQEMTDIETVASEEFCFCLESIDKYRQQAVTLENAKNAGIIDIQPIHGDPKVDNFLFSDHGHSIGLLDLDTVASGLLHHDLGDCLRSCCNRVGEIGRDSAPITFDLSFCRAVLEGYFSGPDTLLSKKQRGYIFDGVLLICFELGVRFFTDHLRGNAYFKVQQDGDNLLRAVNQFLLADDIASKEQEIKAIAISP